MVKRSASHEAANDAMPFVRSREKDVIAKVLVKGGAGAMERGTGEMERGGRPRGLSAFRNTWTAATAAKRHRPNLILERPNFMAQVYRNRGWCARQGNKRGLCFRLRKRAANYRLRFVKKIRSISAAVCAAALSLFAASCGEKDALAVVEDDGREASGETASPCAGKTNAAARCALAKKTAKVRDQASGDGAGGVGESGADGGQDGEVDGETPAEREARLAVEAFDAMYRHWGNQEPGQVTAEDAEKFAEAFRRLPEDEKDAEINHALNLVHDEDVLLFAYILLDKSQGEDTIRTIYNRVMNMDENLKRPVFKMIYNDKSHPCWTDAAHFFNVLPDDPE